ncbi:carcinoembryonic antigen-related cell adhesion molecule 1-like [Peromyscus eremicus]|uniref:carcinoembryonic antigen-related cell adhesion molecule 1-like n=1 Tax=Peromyscus eremicus TaxID=42410 RepID=UPI0027DD96AE|nr:carcinoembryonic antigen-related cell adhesion molecule 1-like [Peromyscus eremicus]
MELTSAPLHKGQVFWRGLLLTVSLLTSWTSPTAAQYITLEAVPPIVAVGNDVLLVVHGLPLQFTRFYWYEEKNSVKHVIATITLQPTLIVPEPQYRDKMTMYKNGSLLIRNVSKDDTRGYKATMTNLYSVDTNLSVDFQVYYAVTKPSIPVNKTIEKDLVSVFLKCPSIDIDNSISWYFKGQSLRIMNRMTLTQNNSSLQIFPASRQDSGDYQCELSNPLDSKMSDPFQLDVIEPVIKPSIQVTNNTVKDLISVFLTCLSNDTGISIHWFFKGQIVELTDSMRLSENNHTLLIYSVKFEHSGDYQCEVSNQVSSKRSDPIQLDIIQPVTKPSIQFTNTTVKDLTSVILKCLTNDTGISIHWLFKGQSLRITNSMRLSPNNSTLEIVSARIEHSGNYQCEVSNQVSSKRSDPIQLDIIQPVTTPSIQVTNNTVKDFISVFLTCLSNDTGISIHWFFKGQSVELKDRMHLSQNNSTLQIYSVRIEDSGDYQCEVSNQVSSKRSDPIQLDIIREHRPSLRAIIGIVAQCLMGLIAIIFVLFFLWRSRHGRELQIENNVKQMDNEPSNLNEPTNTNEPTKLNETSKASLNVKPQKEKKKKVNS